MPSPIHQSFEEVDKLDDVRIPTRLEPVEDLRSSRKLVPTPPAIRPNEPEDDTLPFRPLQRPPVALLGIVHDGREDAEWVRICKDQLIIGRVDGDLRILHDELMSSRHAELIRQLDKGAYRWALRDLKSTNGTFVRVGSALLRHGQEFLMGSRRYRFTAAPAATTSAPHAQGDDALQRSTRGWQTVKPSESAPCLVEVSVTGEGPRYSLNKSINLVGRDPKLSSIIIADDRTVSPRHAQITKDSKGRWHIENTKSKNGIWLSVMEIAFEGSGHFQLGEQRFILRTPS